MIDELDPSLNISAAVKMKNPSYLAGVRVPGSS
jgi:hypothetical protein